MNVLLKKFKSPYGLLFLFVILKIVLQFIVVNPVYELHRDEFLHLDQAKHLAFGFISVPPFTSIISAIIMILGGGLFWIRFFPALFGALTIVFAWLIVEALGGKLWSKIITSCAILFSVMARLNILYQPNAFDILAWTAICYLLIKYINDNNPKWLYWLAICATLGLLNKYNIAFLFIGLFIGLLITRQRTIFTKAPFWKAVIILLLLITPNLIWQYTHHFPVLEHMKVLKESQLDNNSALGFLKDQLTFISGSILLVFAAWLAFIRHKPFVQYRFVCFGIITVLVLFTFLKAKNYYAFGLYPALFAFGSVYIESILSNKLKKFLIPLLILVNLSVFLGTITLVYPIYSPQKIRQHAELFEKMGMLRWEDGKNHHLPQDFADMLGWKEMADKAHTAFNMIPPDEQGMTLVFTDNYGQAGALNYYNRKTTMPEAYSFNTDYIFWIPKMEHIRHIVLVGNEPNNEAKAMFDEVLKIGSVENEYAREKGKGIYLLKNAHDDFTSFFYNIADDRIKTFKIF